MNRSRLLCALALTAGLIAFPVISPVWAAPRPVKPAVYTEHIGGVDQPSLKNAPAAFDPARVDSAAAGAAPRVARTHKPAVLTTQLATGRFTAGRPLLVHQGSAPGHRRPGAYPGAGDVVGLAVAVHRGRSRPPQCRRDEGRGTDGDPADLVAVGRCDPGTH